MIVVGDDYKLLLKSLILKFASQFIVKLLFFWGESIFSNRKLLLIENVMFYNFFIIILVLGFNIHFMLLKCGTAWSLIL